MSNAITRLKASKSLVKQSEDRALTTDASARFILPDDEGAHNTFGVKNIQQVISVSGRQSANMSASPLMTWQVTINDRRLIFWSPQHNTMFKGVSEKPRSASGGHCAFSELRFIKASAKASTLSFLYEDSSTTKVATQLNDETAVISALTANLAKHLNNWLAWAQNEQPQKAVAALAAYDFADGSEDLNIEITLDENGVSLFQVIVDDAAKVNQAS